MVFLTQGPDCLIRRAASIAAAEMSEGVYLMNRSLRMLLSIRYLPMMRVSICSFSALDVRRRNVIGAGMPRLKRSRAKMRCSMAKISC